MRVKKLAILLFVLTGLTFRVAGQQITMYKSFGSTRFEMDTLTISPRQVSMILKDNPVAYNEFKKARRNNSLAGLMGFSGAVLIGVPIVTVIGGGKAEWTYAVIGSALIIGSIPLSNAYYRHAQTALDEYNKKFTSRAEARLYLTGAGARLIVRF